jgi:hypothetical protein
LTTGGGGSSSNSSGGSSGSSSGGNSGSSSGGGSVSGAASSSGGSSGGSSSGGSGSSSGSSSGGSSGGDLACAALSTYDLCDTCCSNNHVAGSTLYDNAFAACLCTAATCQTQCAATDCSQADDAGSSVSGDPCETCEAMYQSGPGDAGTSCSDLTLCAGNADCNAYVACDNNCPP